MQETLEIVVEGAFYAQRLFGPVLREMTQDGPGAPADADVAAISVAINQQIATCRASSCRR